MRLYTIGFAKTSAEAFFTRLDSAGVRKVVDVRLRNESQLAGFTKKDDLRWFLKSLCDIEYEHRPEFAPSDELLDAYRCGGPWEEYARGFVALLRRRRVEKAPRKDLESACLLCSEDGPSKCHRRLAAEYLKERWGNVEILHL